MSKAVLLSIRPQYCELIASGEKTVEVRKTRPKLETPFKCYIYQTRPKQSLIEVVRDGDELYGDTYHGKMVFITTHKDVSAGSRTFGRWGKVIGEFVCRNIDTISPESFIVKEDALIALTGTCLTIQSAKEYAGWKHGTPICDCKDIFGWHISDLVIYDEPKELGEFHHCGENYHYNPAVTRPPQSWCYVEELC